MPRFNSELYLVFLELPFLSLFLCVVLKEDEADLRKDYFWSVIKTKQNKSLNTWKLFILLVTLSLNIQEQNFGLAKAYDVETWRCISLNGFSFQVSIDHFWNSLVDSIVTKKSKLIQNYPSACHLQRHAWHIFQHQFNNWVSLSYRKEPPFAVRLAFSQRQISRVNVVLPLYGTISKLAFGRLMETNMFTDPLAKVK